MTDDIGGAKACRMMSEAVREWRAPFTEKESSETVDNYTRYVRRKWVFIAVCAVLTVIAVGWGMCVGATDITILDAYATLWNHITGNIVNPDWDYTIIQYRLPRVCAGLVAGAGLAVAGVVMQSVLKNPLADPYTTGVSSGAGFGATLAITLGASVSTGPFSIVANAFLFALIPTVVIIAVSKLKNASPTVLIMAGIAVMYIFNAMSTVLKLWSEPEALAALYRWQVGTLGGIGWNGVEIMLVVTVIGCLISMFLSRELNLLSTGDENARSLGIDADKMRILCFLVVALVSAAIVSFTGLIGFVGLVAPHMVRLFIGADNKYLIPASAFFGAALLIISDIIGRVVMSPTIIQVGVITAFLGGPVFLWLIVRKDTKVWG